MSSTFKRLSLKERGHFSNHFTLNPVLRLDFGESSLTIERRSGTITRPYGSLHARVLRTHGAKGYGKAAHAYIPLTLVTIEGEGVSCMFDASAQFPDFPNGPQLLSLVRSKINTTERSESLARVKRRHLIEALVLFSILGTVAVVARTYGI